MVDLKEYKKYKLSKDDLKVIEVYSEDCTRKTFTYSLCLLNFSTSPVMSSKDINPSATSKKPSIKDIQVTIDNIKEYLKDFEIIEEPRVYLNTLGGGYNRDREYVVNVIATYKEPIHDYLERLKQIPKEKEARKKSLLDELDNIERFLHEHKI